MPNQDQINEKNKRTWEGICLRMNKRMITPAQLAFRTGYSRDRIERGVRGEAQPLPSDFLHACVNFFGLTGSRAKYYEETDDILSDDECMELLMAPLARLPRQGNFWD